MKALYFFCALLGFALIPHAKANETRRYRWVPKMGALPQLVAATIDKIFHRRYHAHPVVVQVPSASALLPAMGELVDSGVQEIGPAKVDGTWTQTIFRPDGELVYAAGAVFDELAEDPWLARVKQMQANLGVAKEAAGQLIPQYASAEKAAPEIRLRKAASGGFEAYWRMEYLSPSQDKILFLNLSEGGQLLENGEAGVAAVDGKAWVFPQGPKASALTEVPLHQLNGDGTLTNRFFRITSAVPLDVRSPNLIFFFPETDRRFDLTQVYYTMERSLRWMREYLGAEVTRPLEVRLHIGENGVSNAAFYHNDTIYLGSGDGETYQEMPRDPSVVIHESMHAMIDDYAGLPTEGEGAAFNEGFADFFTALLLKNPRMGENSFLKAPYRRTLENSFRAYQDFDGPYRNGSIIAGSLWDLRAFLADEVLARLAFRTLVRLGKGASYEEFGPAVMHSADGLLSPEEISQVSLCLQNRGWKVSL